MKETKEVLKFAIELGEAVEAAMKDGKFEIAEAGLLIPVLMQIGPAIEGVALVKEELKAADEAAMKDLADYAKAELSLDAEGIEAKIEGALDLALCAYGFVQLFKKEEVVAAE
jgi:hypothetical protein